MAHHPGKPMKAVPGKEWVGPKRLLTTGYSSVPQRSLTLLAGILALRTKLPENHWLGPGYCI